MKQIIIIFCLICLGSKAQEGAKNPNFYSITFADNKTFWAEDITPVVNKDLPIKTLLFKHSLAVYVINTTTGAIVQSNGGYTVGSKVKSIDLYAQTGPAMGSNELYHFEEGEDVIIKFADGLSYIGKIIKASTSNPYYEVQFYHSNALYSFSGFKILKSTGKYKKGEWIKHIFYCLKTKVL